MTYDYKKNIVYHIGKRCGSTTFRKIVESEKYPLTKIDPVVDKNIIKDSKNIIVLRHPLQRFKSGLKVLFQDLGPNMIGSLKLKKQIKKDFLKDSLYPYHVYDEHLEKRYITALSVIRGSGCFEYDFIEMKNYNDYLNETYPDWEKVITENPNNPIRSDSGCNTDSQGEYYFQKYTEMFLRYDYRVYDFLEWLEPEINLYEQMLARKPIDEIIYNYKVHPVTVAYERR